MRSLESVPGTPSKAHPVDPINTYLFVSLASGLLTLFAAFAWLSERLARGPTESVSPVWSFNNMPAGAIVDTARSARESAARSPA